MKKDREKEAQSAVNLAAMILEQLMKMEVKPEISYAALGNAFFRMHLGLNKGREDWTEVCQRMGQYFKDPDS